MKYKVGSIFIAKRSFVNQGYEKDLVIEGQVYIFKGYAGNRDTHYLNFKGVKAAWHERNFTYLGRLKDLAKLEKIIYGFKEVKKRKTKGDT